MLNVLWERLHVAKKRDNFIVKPSVVFDTFYDRSWLENEWAKRVVSDIDNVPMVRDSVFESIVYAGLSPQYLCNGTKNLFLCRYIDNQFNHFSKMGENCYKYLFEIAKMKDVYMIATAFVFPTDSDMCGQQVRFINHNRVVNTAEDFADEIDELALEIGYD